ncbi:Abortive infection phage resistance protein [Nitrospira japonica]|uniref:Abortive infection phage resistance protein n=1 Tax=Nitrospira japonica TaxID=1325564 RepID=A0A1W1IAC5_9BACT|nr:AIPR family protein [Nitrospira japonica]SLM49945.1 Abortive infection phage resistance protein [Nitrospira japonica]
MPKNDTILLDGIVDNRIAENLPSNDRGEVFEYLGCEQILKDYDLSQEEIEAGWVDGEKDGGIDGFFTFVNGYLVQDLDQLALPRREVVIEVWIITAKHHDSFQLSPMNSLAASIPEILDFEKDNLKLKERYSAQLLNARSVFQLTYRRLAASCPTLRFNVSYCTRGQTANIPQEIIGRAKQIEEQCTELYSNCFAEFTFVGAAEIVKSFRRLKKFSIDLPIIESLTHHQGSYVVLARIDDYFRFVTDEKRQLRRYLFDSNVRDYLGSNRVNEDISESLKRRLGPDFWWLNNGVTILATSATQYAKTIQMHDIQIVNGLQTTESIFRYFATSQAKADQRAILVKVIVSNDPVVRDSIIRATNNQSNVELASLHATDKIQRDIEQVLEKQQWFYERRKNYYRNIGRPLSRMVTPLFVAAAQVALVQKNPSQAAILKSKFMRNPISYAAVFNETLPFPIWPAIVEVVKKIEDLLIESRPSGRHGERFLATYRNIFALAAVAKQAGTFAFSLEELMRFDVSKIDRALVEDFLRMSKSIEPGTVRTKSAIRSLCRRFFSAIADYYSIRALSKISEVTLPVFCSPSAELDEQFIDKVDQSLPKQPWKPGVHQHLAKKLKCPASQVSHAIQELILRGRRMHQSEGIVFDREGKVIDYDPERLGQSST